jgi:hypothetical protein
MMRSLGRAVAAAILAAFAGAIVLALAYGGSSALNVHFDETPPRGIIDGIYTAERDPNTGLTFVWTGETATIDLDDFDRRVDWLLQIRVRGARGGGAPNPDLLFFVDGVLVLTHPSQVDYEDVQVPIPSQPARQGLAISIRASSTFVPGPSDPRALGVMLDSLTLTPSAIALPPRAALTGVAVASAALGAAIALLGVTPASTVGTAILLSAALAALVARGFGPYTDYADVVARTTIWTGVVATLLAAGVRRLRGTPFRNTAKFALAFTAAAFLLELLVLLHPNMPIGDALFQAHRFQEVLGGRYYFTSIAPGNYQFPYAPGLYVFAIPFAGLVRRGAADMTILRTTVCAADALVGLLLYDMATRVRGDRLAGALAVGLYHLIPLGFAVVVAGNLTNAFAQSLSVAALALMVSPAVRLEHRAAVLGLAAILAAAFLSHTSTFAIGSVGVCVIAFLFWWRGGPALRSPAAAVLLAVIAAVVFAVVVYYAHFVDTYRTELARISGETAAAAPDAGGRGIADRLASVPRYLHIYFGVPVLALAAWGTAFLWRRAARDRTTLVAAGWLVTCGLFLLLGILTPVDMRYYLAAIPALALFAASGTAIAWASGSLSRGIALTLLAWTVLVALRSWWDTLGG